MTDESPAPDKGPKRAAPETLRGHSLAASLTVRDVAQSLAWYRDVVGFTVDQRYERDGVLRAVSLKAGDVRVLIGLDDGAKGWDRVKGEGFSLMITTTQSVDWIADRIKERGGTLDAEPTTQFGRRVVRLRDPDGFRLVISSEQAAE